MKRRLRSFLYQLHWRLGVTLGAVLLVIGCTGAAYSFSNEILRLLNPQVFRIAAGGAAPLSPERLLQGLQRAYPQHQVERIDLSADAAQPVHARLAPVAGDGSGDLSLWLDPRTGADLGPVRGEAGFAFVLRLHRTLLAGPAGKQVVALAAVSLLLLSLTGLYLRWPRRPFRVAAWLRVRRPYRGRAFLHDLHTSLGSFAMLLYLVSALSGLTWSYGWYRSALEQAAGVVAPVVPPAGPGALDAGRVWHAFNQAAGDWDRAILLLPPAAGEPVQVAWLLRGAAHDRQHNRMHLDPASGAVLAQQRFADRAPAAQVVASAYAIHTGSFFGLPGRILLTLSALCLPAFAVTGLLLYLDRHATRRRVAAARRSLAA